jgi:hypothetical protein
MIKATVLFDGQQIAFNLPDSPTIDAIHKHLPRTVDLRRHVIQLFDPIIGEFFDLNDDGLKSWLRLPSKEKSSMRLQIVPSAVDLIDAFQRIELEMETLFRGIDSKRKRHVLIEQHRHRFV